MHIELGETVKTAAHNLWRGLPLVISGASCLCLFLKNDPIHWLLLGGIFFLLAAAAAMGMTDLPPQDRWSKAAAALFAVLVERYGFLTFIRVWARSKRAGIIGSVLGLSRETVLRIIGVIGCMIGFYALYTLFLIVVRAFRELLAEHCTVRTVPEIGRRLLVNLPLPFSAYAFLTVAKVFPQGVQGGAGPSAVLRRRLPAAAHLDHDPESGTSAEYILPSLGGGHLLRRGFPLLPQLDGGL